MWNTQKSYGIVAKSAVRWAANQGLKVLILVPNEAAKDDVFVQVRLGFEKRSVLLGSSGGYGYTMANAECADTIATTGGNNGLVQVAAASKAKLGAPFKYDRILGIVEGRGDGVATLFATAMGTRLLEDGGGWLIVERDLLQELTKADGRKAAENARKQALAAMKAARDRAFANFTDAERTYAEALKREQYNG